MQLIILASGIGSRLRPLTNDKPKCMVEFNGEPIIDYLQPSFKAFNDVLCVTGYKSKLLEKHLESVPNIKFIYNDSYDIKNMVHSLFCAQHDVVGDVIVTYSDIVYDTALLTELLKLKNTVMPINKNWLNSWEQRMSREEILNDAEDLRVESGIVDSIGDKITKKLPNHQYMGILKLCLSDFRIMRDFYFSLNATTQATIDMTSFLNTLIKQGLVTFKTHESAYFWTEIDSVNDLISQSLP